MRRAAPMVWDRHLEGEGSDALEECLLPFSSSQVPQQKWFKINLELTLQADSCAVHQLPGGFACPNWSEVVPLEFLKDFHTVWLQTSCWWAFVGVSVPGCQESSDCPGPAPRPFSGPNGGPQLLEHSWKCLCPWCLGAFGICCWPFPLPQPLPPCFLFCSTAANIKSLPALPFFPPQVLTVLSSRLPGWIT